MEPSLKRSPMMVAQEGRAENHYIKTKCQCVAALRDFFVALEDFRRLRLNFKLLCFRKDLSLQAFLFLHHLLRFVKTFAIVLLTFAFASTQSENFCLQIQKREKQQRNTKVLRSYKASSNWTLSLQKERFSKTTRSAKIITRKAAGSSLWPSVKAVK